MPCYAQQSRLMTWLSLSALINSPSRGRPTLNKASIAQWGPWLSPLLSDSVPHSERKHSLVRLSTHGINDTREPAFDNTEGKEKTTWQWGHFTRVRVGMSCSRSDSSCVVLRAPLTCSQRNDGQGRVTPGLCLLSRSDRKVVGLVPCSPSRRESCLC